MTTASCDDGTVEVRITSMEILMLPHLTRSTLLFLLPLTVARAQPTTSTKARWVGRLQDLRSLREREGCATGNGVASSDFRIRRGRVDHLLTSGQTDSSWIGDSYQLGHHADVHLVVLRETLGEGDVILSPQLLCTAEKIQIVRPYGRVDSALYAVGSTDGELELDVLSGGAFIKWRSHQHRLLVVAGGQMIRVSGTELVVFADSTQDLALLLVLDGAVEFPAADNMQAPAGHLFELQRGALPREIAVLDGDALRSARDDAHAHRDLFPRSSRFQSLLHNPWAYAGGAAIGTAGGLVIHNQCCRRKSVRTHNISIGVNIPL